MRLNGLITDQCEAVPSQSHTVIVQINQDVACMRNGPLSRRHGDHATPGAIWKSAGEQPDALTRFSAVGPLTGSRAHPSRDTIQEKQTSSIGFKGPLRPSVEDSSASPAVSPPHCHVPGMFPADVAVAADFLAFLHGTRKCCNGETSSCILNTLSLPLPPAL
ncbi:unnamed protein product [Boreogadus saida]